MELPCRIFNRQHQGKIIGICDGGCYSVFFSITLYILNQNLSNLQQIMLIARVFTLDLRFFNCLSLWCCYGYWNVKNIANFVNMALKSFFLMRTWKVSAQIQLLYQNNMTIWIINHRNIGNIPSTSVAMGTDLFFLKLSQNTQSIAFRLITLYLLNRICCFLLKRKVQISALGRTKNIKCFLNFTPVCQKMRFGKMNMILKKKIDLVRVLCRFTPLKW